LHVHAAIKRAGKFLASMVWNRRNHYLRRALFHPIRYVRKESSMKKTGIALAALAALSVAAASPADARPRGHYHGGPGPALFGLAAGAMTAGAAAASQPYYYDYGPRYYNGGGPYNYYGGPVYYGPRYRHHRHHRHW
jgi:hypothetical protein